MKKLFFLTMVLALNLLNAQDIAFDKWQTIETQDEFGDSTGEKVDRLVVKGKFSNSATSNSDLIVKVVDYGESCSISLYEYNRPPAVTLVSKGSFGTIKYKDSNGEIGTLNTFASKSGGLYFSKESYIEFMRVLQESKTLPLIVREENFSKYGNSVYKFTLIAKD